MSKTAPQTTSLVDILELLNQDKVQIVAYLSREFLYLSRSLPRYQWDKQILSELQEFIISGKMFRGSLFLQTYAALTETTEYTPDALLLATCIETIESGLLIHDDVMDEDRKRRGKPSIHTGWSTQIAGSFGSANSDHDGKSIAIMMGDLLYFIAFEWLQNLLVSERIKSDLIVETSRELTLLGLAQVEDYRAALAPEVSQAEIMAIHAGKTGHYTGGWPLAMAGILAELPPAQVVELKAFGIELGVLYQLVDDRLGVFGESAQTGKYAATDILKGKKTIYYFLAQQELTGTSRRRFLQQYGRLDLAESEIQELKDILVTESVHTEVDVFIEERYQECLKLLKQLSVSSETRSILRKYTELTHQRVA